MVGYHKFFAREFLCPQLGNIVNPHRGPNHSYLHLLELSPRSSFLLFFFIELIVLVLDQLVLYYAICAELCNFFMQLLVFFIYN